jgi:hypothetical protein
MPRNRIIYAAEGLFLGPTGALPSGVNLTGIQRVQSVSHTASITRTDVNQFGQLAAIDRVIISPPTVSLNFSCLLVNAINANRLGFVTNGTVSCISNILSGTRDVNNYYIALGASDDDLLGTTGAGCFGFGNGFISNATFEAAVGAFATESYTVDALNYRVYTQSSGFVPSVDPRTGLEPNTATFSIPAQSSGTATSKSALQPGDISFSLANTLGFSPSDLHVQNFNISIPLAREDITQLGTKFAFAKVVTFPVVVTATFSANAGDIAAGGLADVLCSDAPVNFTINLREPDCQGAGTIAIRFNLNGFKMDSTDYSSDIGSNATVNFNYSAQIGGAGTTSVGVLISGISS